MLVVMSAGLALALPVQLNDTSLHALMPRRFDRGDLDVPSAKQATHLDILNGGVYAHSDPSELYEVAAKLHPLNDYWHVHPRTPPSMHIELDPTPFKVEGPEVRSPWPPLLSPCIAQPMCPCPYETHMIRPLRVHCAPLDAV